MSFFSQDIFVTYQNQLKYPMIEIFNLQDEKNWHIASSEYRIIACENRSSDKGLTETWNDNIILDTGGIDVTGIGNCGLDVEGECVDHVGANLVLNTTVTFLWDQCYKSVVSKNVAIGPHVGC
jgi:hypothetical protein